MSTRGSFGGFGLGSLPGWKVPIVAMVSHLANRPGWISSGAADDSSRVRLFDGDISLTGLLAVGGVDS